MCCRTGKRKWSAHKLEPKILHPELALSRSDRLESYLTADQPPYQNNWSHTQSLLPRQRCRARSGQSANSIRNSRLRLTLSQLRREPSPRDRVWSSNPCSTHASSTHPGYHKQQQHRVVGHSRFRPPHDGAGRKREWVWRICSTAAARPQQTTGAPGPQGPPLRS